MSKASKMRAEVINELWRVGEKLKITIDSLEKERLLAQKLILEKVLNDFDDIDERYRKESK